MRRLIFFICLCFLTGCVSLPTIGQPRTSMKHHFQQDAMRAEVLKYLSPGMPIENAERIMKDSGFKCEDSWCAGSQVLRCSAVYATHFLMDNEIHVLLYHEAGKLTDVKVDCFSVGP
jgi:hypothetical protein